MILSLNKKYLLYTNISNIFINYKYIYVFHNNYNLESLKEYCLINNLNHKILLTNFVNFNNILYKNLFITSNFIIYSNNLVNILNIYNKLNLINIKYILLGLIYKNIYFNTFNLSVLFLKINKIDELNEIIKILKFIVNLQLKILYIIYNIIFFILKKIMIYYKHN